MITETKTAPEIVELIKGQAILSLGPWPNDLKLFVFVTNDEWSCGLSPATQTSDGAYRDGVIKIAQRLKASVGVKTR